MSAVARLAHTDAKPRPYTATATHAGVVWARGQVPVEGQGAVPAAIGDQVEVALDNLEQVLQEAGAWISSLLKLTVFLSDLDEFEEYNVAYQRRLASPPLPPRTTVQVAGFRGAKRVEIDAVAAVVHLADESPDPADS